MALSMSPERRRGRAALLALALSAAPGSWALAEESVDPRARAGEWDLTALYADLDAWDADFERLEGKIDAFGCDPARITHSASELAECLDRVSTLRREYARLDTYASLASDVDLRDGPAQERRTRAAQLGARLAAATAAIRPTLLQLPAATLEQWQDDPRLAVHRRYLDKLLRLAPHTLSADTEAALAALSPVTGAAAQSYSLLANADIDWPSIEVDGESVRLDQSGYQRLRAHPDAVVRQRVFEAFWAVWGNYTNTIGSQLAASVDQHVIEARLRHYDSAMQAALADDDIPTQVYTTLIDAANAHLPTLHRYLDLRRRMLALDTLRYSDIYVPLAEAPRSFALEDARSLTAEALKPLGDAYGEALEEALGSPWTSAYPAIGKRSGAYMSGSAYDVHPYVLMNFTGDYQSVSTYAHEWGHGVHSMFSNARQPFETADYPIFLAEVASTTNEQLLIEHMLETDPRREAQLFYLGEALENLRGTFFRQAQFAEFEAAIHAAAERGEALSGERLTRLYGETLRKYYGVEQGVTEVDPHYYLEWAFVPHFHYDFYVYQYATSITAGQHFAQRILAGDNDTREAYLELLSQGDAKDAYQLLREAGVDLASSAPYDELAARMDDLITRIEALLEQS